MTTKKKTQKKTEETVVENDSPYKIGQIIYLQQGSVIIPARIVEEVTKTTIEGTTKTYNVSIKNDVSPMDKVLNKFTISETLESIENAMVDQATNAVKTMIQKVKDMEKEWYNT